MTWEGKPFMGGIDSVWRYNLKTRQATQINLWIGVSQDLPQKRR
jgi:hypothetical protein